ncbi:hypothetical protein BaRGS_00036970 [Batillaria attramentaria]|uniref:Uncharacterized protein n=1 Tax=Batillaria attramentaria TaxID=370345 RepID=A0ABD0JAC9_9CAEN
MLSGCCKLHTETHSERKSSPPIQNTAVCSCGPYIHKFTATDFTSSVRHTGHVRMTAKLQTLGFCTSTQEETHNTLQHYSPKHNQYNNPIVSAQNGQNQLRMCPSATLT